MGNKRLWNEDQGAVRSAIADILVFLSGERCTDEKAAKIREILEKAVEVIGVEEIRA